MTTTTTKLTIQPRRVFIDTQHGETSGTANITYEKYPDEELWMRRPGDDWERPNLFQMIGTADADERGRFNIRIAPGALFAIGIYQKGWGPTSAEPQAIDEGFVIGLQKQPEPTPLITSMTEEHGGTFVIVSLATSVPTRLILAAASRTEPEVNADNLLAMQETEGAFSWADTSLGATPMQESVATSHAWYLSGLLPGHHTYAGAIVVAADGAWDQRALDFTLASRKLTVKIDNLHVSDDGDGETVGEAQFWIRVQYPADNSGDRILQEFYRPTSDVNSGDDYPLGFAYLGTPQVASENETGFLVTTWGSEDDGWKGDEHAGSSPHPDLIEFPVGPDEQVEEEWWSTDASPSRGDTFRYYIQGSWWVEYEQG